MGKFAIPVGEENFEQFRLSGGYYVDKTKLIVELLQDSCKVNLITRPRRFGKTLAMSMLKYFFDIRRDSREIFEGLEVTKHKALCREWMNQWPVLSVSFKDMAKCSFLDSYNQFAYNISSLCVEYAGLLESGKVDEGDRKRFRRLRDGEAARAEVENSLFMLTRMLYMHYGRPVILLIDEYDVPLAKANEYGYYQEMLDMIRSVMSTALKTNDFLKFAVVTGCLRIARESIFTGTNHFKSNSVAGKNYLDCFGFTGEEVEGLLDRAGFSSRSALVKEWYDGYHFGAYDIYCPWDVVNYLNDLGSDPEMMPGSYWKDTSHNDIIKRFIGKKGMEVNDKFETLLSGGHVKVRITEESTYDFDKATENDFWGILYLTGYLTPVREAGRKMGTEDSEVSLQIPNKEIRTIFRDTIADWFKATVEGLDRRELFSAVWNGDAEKISSEITALLRKSISYYDYKEEFYHAFLAGIFAGGGFQVESNREHGEGRSDVVVKDYTAGRVAMFEAKRAGKKEDLPKKCGEALRQMEERGYGESFLEDYDDVLCYGIAFFRKQCRVMLQGKPVLPQSLPEEQQGHIKNDSI